MSVEVLVKYEVQQSIGIVTISRSARRNALSRELIRQLTETFELARGTPEVRCVILRAEGTVFCAGMDLAELQQSLDAPAEATPVWDDALRLAHLYDLIYSLPKPTVAAVQGPAVAGGAGLVTACDLAVAATGATFGYPEVRRGLVAAMVMPHLLRHVGERTARYLLLTGELIGSAEALRCGLVNEMVEPDRLLDRALELARACAAGGPHALAATKDLLRQFSKQAVSLEEAARGSAAPRLTPECREGLRAFFEKRPAPWIEPS